MCQQSLLSKTVKIISIVSLSTFALGSVLTNSSWAVKATEYLYKEDIQPILKKQSTGPKEEINKISREIKDKINPSKVEDCFEWLIDDSEEDFNS